MEVYSSYIGNYTKWRYIAATVWVLAGLMHMVAAAGKELKWQLGPIIFTTIKVNTIPSKTLVDTGSLATIISLEFVQCICQEPITPADSSQQLSGK